MSTFPQRFNEGDRVRIQTSGLVGKILRLLEPSVVAKEQPYSIRLDSGSVTWAPDSDLEKVS